jgi:RNA polymerase sigma factor (sigma-70 family)
MEYNRMSPDAELLRRYSRQHDERAFAEVVQRHLGLVYAAALRRTGCRVHLAEDISEKVFIELARRAGQLDGHPALVGWLYRCTRNAAIDVMRAEQSRQRSAQAFATMPDTAPTDSPVDWERLRPVLDEAMDQLKERDREVMLLRFFQGLTFNEIGARLELSENAARMRTERALDKLRGYLGRRGVTSTTAALGLLLTNQTFAQAPIALVTSVTTTALAAGPAGAIATFFTSLLLNKSAVAVIGAACATGITLLAWTAVDGEVSDKELAALRAENARLKEGSAVGASGAAATTVARELTEQTNTLLQSVTKRLQENRAARSSGHRNHGQATPYEAFRTYAWAIDAGESEALENILTYDDKGRKAIQALHASLPAAIRATYLTPEKFVVFLYIADTILRPLKGADMMEDYAVIEIEPGVAAVRRKDGSRGGMKWIKTGEVWKIVVPPEYPEYLAKRILGNEMLDNLGLKQAVLK